jgi:hypothetical protein
MCYFNKVNYFSNVEIVYTIQKSKNLIGIGENYEL